MIANPFNYIGHGLYTLSEANRLTGVPVRSIRRWTSGYHFRRAGRQVYSPPVVESNLPRGGAQAAISFADLIEVRFLHAFRRHGVGWSAIRIASTRAGELLGRDHPFSSKRFSTDGRTILAEFVSETGDPVLLDLVRNQYELRRIVSKFMVGEIDFGDSDTPTRWWPVKGSRRIVVDPSRAFGSPVVAEEGVPTRVLASAALAEDSIEIVASIFEVDPISVAEAVAFELREHEL